MTDETAMGQLFGAYLNQDWAFDYPSASDAVDDFARSNPELASRLVTEIAAAVRDEHRESALAELVLARYDSGFDPAADGLTYRDWLISVADRVQYILDHEGAGPGDAARNT